MNRFSVAVALLGLMLVTVSAVPTAEEVSESERNAFQETASVEDGVVANGITPLKSIFLSSIGQRVCWQCSSPCTAYACCNDGYPQCCRVGSSCKCCR